MSETFWSVFRDDWVKYWRTYVGWGLVEAAVLLSYVLLVAYPLLLVNRVAYYVAIMIATYAWHMLAYHHGWFGRK